MSKLEDNLHLLIDNESMSEERSAKRDNVLYQAFNFDHWKDLYRQNPKAFELQRKALLRKMIAQSQKRNQRRLQGLVFQVDIVRELSSNSVKACIEILNLMWQSFYRLNESLNHLEFKDSNLNKEKFQLNSSCKAHPDIGENTTQIFSQNHPFSRLSSKKRSSKKPSTNNVIYFKSR